MVSSKNLFLSDLEFGPRTKRYATLRGYISDLQDDGTKCVYDIV